MFKGTKVMLLLTAIIMLIFSTSVLAIDIDDDLKDVENKPVIKELTEEEYNERLKTGRENIGMSEKNHDVIELFGTGRPLQDPGINLAGGKSKSFAGYAEHSNLYSNNRFYGSDKYFVTAKNFSDKPLKIKVKKNGMKVYTTVTVRPKHTMYFETRGMSSSDKIYLKFYGPLDTSGNIKAF